MIRSGFIILDLFEHDSIQHENVFQECETRDIPVSFDSLVLYREFCFPHVMAASEGSVVKLIDSNFGLLKSGRSYFSVHKCLDSLIRLFESSRLGLVIN